MFDRFVFKLEGAGRTMVLLALFSTVAAVLTVVQAVALCRVLVALWEGAGFGEAEAGAVMAGAASSTAVAGAGAVAGDAGGFLGSIAGQLIIFALAFFARRVVEAVRERMLERYAAGRVAKMRSAALRRLTEDRALAGTAGGVRLGTAEGCALVMEGAERTERFIELSLGKAIDMAVTPLILLVAIFWADAVSGVIALIGYPVIIFYMILIGKNAHEVAEKRQVEQARLSNHFLDALRGLDTLRSFGRARGHARAIFAVSERLREATMDTLRVATLSSAVLDLIATLALAAVSVMLGFRLVDGSMQIFGALMALVLVPDFYRPIRQFGADYHATLDGRQAFTKMREVVDAPARAVAAVPKGMWDDGSRLEAHELTVRFADEEASDRAEHAAASGEVAGRADDATATGERAGRADDATATGERAGRSEHAAASGEDSSSAARHRALDNISFTMHGCERVAVVGASGSGKSTLLSLLAGFLDASNGWLDLDWDGASVSERGEGGEYGDRIDSGEHGGSAERIEGGEGGERSGRVERDDHGHPRHQLSSLHAPAWQRQVLYIPQAPYIFHATLRENIAFYVPDASEEDVRRAVTAAGLGTLVKALPLGLETMIGDGEGARRLSGGEAQRVAIARAALDRTRRILLLDEPTAHLDLETELELKERLLPLMEGRLVVLATHRLHWLFNMDRALVLRDGQLVAYGDARELLASGEVARSLEPTRPADAGEERVKPADSADVEDAAVLIEAPDSADAEEAAEETNPADAENLAIKGGRAAGSGFVQAVPNATDDGREEGAAHEE